MSRLRRQRSRVLDKARLRAAAISQVLPREPAAPLSVQDLQTQIKRAQRAMDDYNRLLASVDAAKAVFEKEEAAVNALAVRLFAHVRSRYGLDSPEYLAAGGKPAPARRKRRSAS